MTGRLLRIKLITTKCGVESAEDQFCVNKLGRGKGTKAVGALVHISDTIPRFEYPVL